MTLNTALLYTQNLNVRRGERELLRDFNFVVNAGEGVHLLGPNGAGKTSLLRVLAGLTLPEHGNVKQRGLTIYLGHGQGLKNELTVIENLLVYARLAGVTEPLIAIERALQRIGLLSHADHLVMHLSAGQKRRAALSRLLIEPAALWLLDEPFSALDVNTGAWLCNELDSFMTRGGAVVLTSHQTVNTRMPLREVMVELH